jgi:hypothetical protein
MTMADGDDGSDGDGRRGNWAMAEELGDGDGRGNWRWQWQIIEGTGR